MKEVIRSCHENKLGRYQENRFLIVHVAILHFKAMLFLIAVIFSVIFKLPQIHRVSFLSFHSYLIGLFLLMDAILSCLFPIAVADDVIPNQPLFTVVYYNCM